MGGPRLTHPAFVTQAHLPKPRRTHILHLSPRHTYPNVCVRARTRSHATLLLLLFIAGGDEDNYGDAPAAGAPLLLAAAAAFLGHAQRVGWVGKDLVWVVPDARCGSLRSLHAWAHMYQVRG